MLWNRRVGSLPVVGAVGMALEGLIAIGASKVAKEFSSISQSPLLSRLSPSERPSALWLKLESIFICSALSSWLLWCTGTRASPAAGSPP